MRNSHVTDTYLINKQTSCAFLRAYQENGQAGQYSKKFCIPMKLLKLPGQQQTDTKSHVVQVLIVHQVRHNVNKVK